MEKKSSAAEPHHHRQNRRRHSKSRRRRRSNPVSKQGKTPQIPNDVITEILTRLPAKALVRFMCVSRSWYSLISNPDFIKSHLRKSSENEEYTRHNLIFLVREDTPESDRNFYFMRCPLSHALSAPNPITYKDTIILDHYVGGWRHLYIRIIGCSNGLVCIDMWGEIILWNPSIGKSKYLVDFGDKYDFDHYSYTFGYDEVNDDYKVFQIRQNGDCTGGETWFDVYNLRTNSWRNVCSVGGGKLHWRSLVRYDCILADEEFYFVSGKLHWTMCGECGAVGKIVSLDLENGKFGEVEEPVYEKGSFECRLGVLGGFLALFCYYRRGRVLGHWGVRYEDEDEGHLDLWIMKEYGVKESWTKVVLLPQLYDPWRVLYCTPVFLMKDGKILFQRGSVLDLYNPGNDSDNGITNFSELLQVNIYVESLLLLNDNEARGPGHDA